MDAKNDFIRGLSRFPQVSSICMIGSTTRDYVIDSSDLDILIVTGDTLSPEMVSNYINDMHSEITAERYDDILRIMGFDIPVSIALLDSEFLLSTLKDISSGLLISPSYKPWAVLGYVPEVLCADIVDSVIIHDGESIIKKFKKELNYYPNELRQAILMYSIDELKFKYQIANKAFTNCDYVTSNLAIASAILPLVRGMFAMKRIYFRGMKYLDRQLSKYIPEHKQTIESLTIGGIANLQEKLTILSISLDEFAKPNLYC